MWHIGGQTVPKDNGDFWINHLQKSAPSSITSQLIKGKGHEKDSQD